MLPILVLFVASSALAAPGYQGNSLVGQFFDSVENGDISINVVNIGAILRDLSSKRDTQSLANGQAVTALGLVSSGRPGDSCAAANYVNAYTRYVQGSNSADGVREALGYYIQVINGYIDNIVGLVTNKDSLKYKSGPQGGCPGEGRSYQFDAAWDIILGQYQDRLLDEEYCVAKRMYCAVSASSSNVAAEITATALPPTNQVFDLSNRQLVDFMSRVPSRNNIAQSAGSLKQALASAVNRVTL